ncbi:MAG: ROK family protein, partial [Sphingomonadales bacterium]
MKKLRVGIDIGGTNTKFGIVDRDGTIVTQGRMLTNAKETVQGFIEELYQHLYPMIEAAGGRDQFAGIGIGAPNGNYYTGNIEHAANLKWKGIVPLAAMIQERFGMAVKLTNDANAA